MSGAVYQPLLFISLLLKGKKNAQSLNCTSVHAAFFFKTVFYITKTGCVNKDSLELHVAVYCIFICDSKWGTIFKTIER